MTYEEFDRLIQERLKQLSEHDPINDSIWKSFIDKYSKKVNNDNKPNKKIY